MADSSFFDGRGTGNTLALSTSHCSLQRGFWQTFGSLETLINSIASALLSARICFQLKPLGPNLIFEPKLGCGKVNAIALSSEFDENVTESHTDHTVMFTLWHQSRNTLQRED